MKKSLLYLSFILLLFTSCSKHIYSQIPKGIYKLEGLWEMKNDDGSIFYELWEINPDSTLKGKDFIVKPNKDTILTENFEIIEKNDSVYYVATVMEQNGSKTVYFKLISFNPMVFVFENKKHDFPQMITYSRKTDDLYAVILEGPDIDNKIKSMEFRFTRALNSK